MPSKTGTVYIKHSSDKKPEKAKGEGFLKNKDSASNESLKLDILERNAGLIIFEARSLRPLFTRNKDKITICLNRVTITRGSLFSGEEYPMAVENITSARIYRNFRFATLDIDTFGVVKPDPIKYMGVEDARLARRYILALIECKKAGIDLTGLDIEDLREKLKNIGMVRFSADQKDYHNL